MNLINENRRDIFKPAPRGVMEKVTDFIADGLIPVEPSNVTRLQLNDGIVNQNKGIKWRFASLVLTGVSIVGLIKNPSDPLLHSFFIVGLAVGTAGVITGIATARSSLPTPTEEEEKEFWTR